PSLTLDPVQYRRISSNSSCKNPLDGISRDFPMEQYIYEGKNDCIYITNLKRNWEKLPFANEPIVAIKCPAMLLIYPSR
ncbi:hypothetical protein DBR06_SOUSAS9910056, partial [Sousa chinensis]